MVLHGIEQPSIWHGNTLTGNKVFGGLFIGTPGRYVEQDMRTPADLIAIIEEKQVEIMAALAELRK